MPTEEDGCRVFLRRDKPCKPDRQNILQYVALFVLYMIIMETVPLPPGMIGWLESSSVLPMASNIGKNLAKTSDRLREAHANAVPDGLDCYSCLALI